MSYRTRQKEVVMEILGESGRPLTAEQVWEGAVNTVPEIGLSTVYRIMKAELEAGRVRRVEIPGAGSVYEVTASGHHHYFVCEQCHSVLAVEGCVGGIQKLLPEGSRMRRHEFVIYGDCPECVKL